MKPTHGGFADVNGIKLYHEVYGEGDPLVLLHGGLTTIGEMKGWIEPLSRTRRVIAAEMQGHGHTADTDRPMTWATMGGLKEPGWINTKLSKSRLAILPGYIHYNFLTSPEVPRIVERFLAG